MKNAPTSSSLLPQVKFAAGGLVWQQHEGVRKLAVIHRPKYDDWTLPKGKPEPGETLAETALREVWEEIGCKGQFLGFAGVTHYAIDKNVEKVVLFWNMMPTSHFEFVANPEVDMLEWHEPVEVLRILSHPAEQELISRCL